MDHHALRTKIEGLVRSARDRGAPCDWFESLYRDADGRTDLIPWADDEPTLGPLQADFVLWSDQPWADFGMTFQDGPFQTISLQDDLPR